MNWLVIILVGIIILALLIFLIMRNQKDKKEFETQLKNLYRKSKDEEGDVDIEEVTK